MGCSVPVLLEVKFCYFPTAPYCLKRRCREFYCLKSLCMVESDRTIFDKNVEEKNQKGRG